MMSQLDAYMQKKQFPMDFQHRLRFFYKKKFRRFYYREHELMGMLSGKRGLGLNILEAQPFADTQN